MRDNNAPMFFEVCSKWIDGAAKQWGRKRCGGLLRGIARQSPWGDLNRS